VNISKLLLSTFLCFSLIGKNYRVLAQNEVLNQDTFITELNKALEDQFAGVTVEGISDSKELIEAMNVAGFGIDSSWAAAAARNAQDFGIVAMDAGKNVIDVFGASTPFEKTAEGWVFPGYNLPPGGSFNTVGSAGYADAIGKLAKVKNQIEVTSSLKKVVNKIVGAGGYIVDTLCSMHGRPSQIELHLDAGLNWVVKASTDTKVI